MYIKAITLKNDASREMNNFQRDLFFKRAFLKMETLNFIFYIVENSVCDHLPPCLKKNPKKIHKIQRKTPVPDSLLRTPPDDCFCQAIRYFWTRPPNTFHNVIYIIFNQ